MRTLQHLTICVWFVLAACASADKSKMPKMGNNFAVDAISPVDESFKLQPANTILKFLQWYRGIMKRIKQIEMVTKSTDEQSAGMYAVNLEATEQYLTELQKSGFISDKYIDTWRTYFTQCNEYLKENPQTEGPVKGLDFDLVMWSKDCDEDLKKIEKSTVEYQKITNDQGIVMIGLPTVGRIKYKISKQDGKWLIDDIKDMRSALDQAQND